MLLLISYDTETDGRIMAQITALPGCLVYGRDRNDARRLVVELALKIVAGEICTGERPVPVLFSITFVDGYLTPEE